MSLAHLPLVFGRPARPLSGSVRISGDKATSHHALLLAALAVGESRITGLLEHGDVLRTASVLRALGTEVIQEAPGIWRVAGRGVGGLREPEGVLDVGGSGTAARMICGILASHDLFATVTGSASLRRRPMRWMTDMLQDCGARFQCPAEGWLPLAVQGARNAMPIDRRLSLHSTPAKSALLLAGLNAPGWTRVVEDAPTCDHAARLLRHFGASVVVEVSGDGWATGVMGQPELQAADLAIPGDSSLAAYPLVAALIVPGSVATVRGVALDPRRTGLFATLRDMGGRLEIARERLEGGGPVGDVTASYTGLRGAEVPAARAASMADDFPILAVAAACAAGPTRIRGHAGLRAKDGGLLSAAAMLRLNGVRIDDEGDNLTVHGTGAAPTGGVRIEAGTAPRIALCGLILGLAAASPVRVDDAAAIERDFPGVLALMGQVGAPIA
jgi:3-phosphoshikimate 1-carboxyvinyltransferase